ncbi:CDP-alcohol phosphatidyltransferase family protein [Nitrosococcus wardiae]|uniref:CDP-alcohol phosphatidyltransferase family protein n=1 Tax=Nitrosococcus wardiae TaxID=1814290 RepID=A0A4V1AW73_9GAMM|nr:CDP-alcohol phosphatidyltransferase family protein [Nitrosococcus wardiae]QBQ55635.1 CDP-alcohol phosphatidyltransferase family protein [Nitrosococcus wardiae]
MSEQHLDHSSRKCYRKFLIFQSSISILLLAVTAFYLQMLSPGYAFGIVLTALWVMGSHGFLAYFLRAWRTPADWVTLLRFWVGIAGLMIASCGGAVALVLVMMIIASFGDWMDGRLATLYGGTPQGAILDAETDQALVFMLAVLGVTVGGLGVWLLLFPLYRYGYVLLLEVFAIPADDPKPKAGGNLRGRIVCAATQVVLLANLLPHLALPAKNLLSALALVFLTYSFADDILYQFRERFIPSLHSPKS